MLVVGFPRLTWLVLVVEHTRNGQGSIEENHQVGVGQEGDPQAQALLLKLHLQGAQGRNQGQADAELQVDEDHEQPRPGLLRAVGR